MSKIKITLTLFFLATGLVAVLWRLKSELTNFQARRVNPAFVVRYIALDVGQGDATLIELPDKTRLLVDCGPDASILPALGRHMRFYYRSIDYLIVTHADSDHYGGCIDVMRRFHIKKIIYNGQQKGESEHWQTFWKTLNAKRQSGAEYFEIKQVTTLALGDETATTLTFFYPDHDIVADPLVPGRTKPNRNNLPLVFKLSYGDTDALFTADMETELEEYLIKRYGQDFDVEVLKVGHHGSDTSTGDELVKATTPDIATISVGAKNSYGHPSRRVIRRLERHGIQVLRTDTEGDIMLALTTSSVYVSGTGKKR